ncbi:MAG: carboxypeptidase-like regulatory domain-containing protein [Eubacteriales bacterium]
MKLKLKISAIILALCMVIPSLIACTGEGVDTTAETTACARHTDTDSDGVCDVCGAELGNNCNHVDLDGDNLCDLCDIIMVVPVEYTVILTDENKTAVAYATVKLYADGELAAEGQTNSDGKFTGSLIPGSYVVMFEGLADGWFVESNGLRVTLSEDSNTFEFTAASSAADGTEEHPFYISTEPLEIDFEANQTLCFYTKGSDKYLVINSENVKVTYSGNDYLPENGTVRILLAGADSNSTTPFTVTCSKAEKLTLTLELTPGSYDLPFDLVLAQTTAADIKKDTTVYYSVTAPADGFLVLECPTAENNIMMYNKTAYVVTGYTAGGRSVVVKVSSGDEVSIAVASSLDVDSTTVEFTVTLHAGTQADPIPAYAGTVVRLAENETAVLEYHGDTKTLRVSANGIKIAVNGTELTATAELYTTEIGEGSIITVTNTSTEKLDVALAVN